MTIRCDLTSYVIDIECGLVDGNKLIFQDNNQSSNQLWQVENNTVRIKGHELCMDTENGSIEEGTSIIAKNQEDKDSNQWDLIDIKD